MLKLIAHILKEKRKELRLPIILMSLDSAGGMLLYIMLYFTVVGLVRNTLTGEIIITYSLICLGAVVFRLIIYRTGYYLCFARGAEVCAQMRLDLANHYRSLSLGYFNRHSSGALLETLVKDITNFELIITHTLPALVKTAVTAALIFQGLAAGAVLAVVGIDFVERGGKGFFEGKFGVVKVGFGAAVFPVHGAPVEEGQVEADAAAQYRHVEQVFAVFGRGAQRGIQRDAGIPAAVLRLLAFEGGL